MSEFTYTGVDKTGKRVTGSIHAPTEGVKAAQAWVATSATKDFRQSSWTATDLKPGPEPGTFLWVGTHPKPGEHLAVFGDVTFTIDGLDYHLSTQIRLVRGDAE